MKFNPCCCKKCKSLQVGVLVVAIVDGVLKTILFLYLVLVGAGVVLLHRMVPGIPNPDEQLVNRSITAALLAGIGVWFAIRLFIGALKRNPGPCQAWMYYNIVLTFISLVSHTITLIIGPIDENVSAGSQILFLILDVYLIVCVWYYIKELEHDQLDETATPVYASGDASSSTIDISGLTEGGVKSPSPSHSPTHLPNSEGEV